MMLQITSENKTKILHRVIIVYELIINKNMKKLNPNTFTFRLPNGLRNKLETIADDNEVSLSELVRYSLKSLANNEQKFNQTENIITKRMVWK